MATRLELIELLEPALEGLGYELVDLDFRTGSSALVRLYIDKPDGVGLDDCAEVSREVSALLDVADPIPGEYVLEVSSPGEKRALRKPSHFKDFAGNRVKVELTNMHQGRLRYVGNLIGFENDEVLVQTDEELVRLSLNAISKAHLAPQARATRRDR